MDNRERAMLLTRGAKQVDNETDRRALLDWAEQLVSGIDGQRPKPEPPIPFPISIVSRQPKKGEHKRHNGVLLQGWRVQVDDRQYPSPSAAASAIAGHPVNGWFYWRYKNESGDERPIDDLRKLGSVPALPALPPPFQSQGEQRLQHDPKEDDPKLRSIIEEAEKEAENNLVGQPRGMGFCHRLWAEEKRILRNKYGIEWKSPSEMNPGVIFD